MRYGQIHKHENGGNRKLHRHDIKDWENGIMIFETGWPHLHTSFYLCIHGNDGYITHDDIIDHRVR